MPDQSINLSDNVLPPGERTEFTPEEKAEFDAFLVQLDRKLDDLDKRSSRTLILMGLEP